MVERLKKVAMDYTDKQPEKLRAYILSCWFSVASVA
jgi:hypothetical protein